MKFYRIPTLIQILTHDKGMTSEQAKKEIDLANGKPLKREDWDKLCVAR